MNASCLQEKKRQTYCLSTKGTLDVNGWHGAPAETAPAQPQGGRKAALVPSQARAQRTSSTYPPQSHRLRTRLPRNRTCECSTSTAWVRVTRRHIHERDVPFSYRGVQRSVVSSTTTDCTHDREISPQMIRCTSSSKSMQDHILV